MNVKQAQNSNVKVALRVRPFNQREKKHNSKCCVTMKDNTTTLTDPTTQHTRTFTYDHSFWSFDPSHSHFVSQQKVFDKIGRQVLRHASDGYNCAVMTYGQTGCLDGNTPILMANGRVNLARHIQVGDLLMDSRGQGNDPRRVTRLIRGYQEMFEVRDLDDPTTSYRVNMDHILTLWDQVEKKVVDVPIRTYIQYKNMERKMDVKTLPEPSSSSETTESHDDHRYWGIRLNCIEWPEQHVPWNAYWMGICLVSSLSPVSSNALTVRTVYPEVVRNIQQFCEDYGFMFRVSREPFKYYVYTLSTHSHTRSRMESLVFLLTPQRIPSKYVQNSLQVRWSLLNGILDMVGRYDFQHRRYVLDAQNLSPQLISDIQIVARSLGIRPSTPTNKVIILENIRYKIPGLQNWMSPAPTQAYSLYPIVIREAGVDKYYGFSLDGGDHRFVLKDFTVTHNSGKTYTQMGGTASETQGLIPRICQNVFQHKVEITYLEIYAEQVRDLLRPGHKQPPSKLSIREHPVLGPYVPGLTKIPVQNYDDLQKWMDMGNQNRVTAATKMNNQSSRSHAIFTVHLYEGKSTPSQSNVVTVLSKIRLVDLAGSERVKDSQVQGIHLKEAININKSLTILGRVISTLAKRSSSSSRNDSFIPFRDSVLTWLLKDSLGGSSQTYMIATISPADINYDESLNTLQYASRAKKIVNQVLPSGKKIKLREFIGKLKTDIQSIEGKITELMQDPLGSMKITNEVYEYRQMIMDREQILGELEKSWDERIHQFQEQQALWLDELDQARSYVSSQGSHGTMVSSSSPPKLINVSDEISIDHELYYKLHPQQRYLADLGFSGYVEYSPGGGVMVHYNDDSPTPTYLNNEPLTSTQIGLAHNDILAWGSFRFKLSFL